MIHLRNIIREYINEAMKTSDKISLLLSLEDEDIKRYIEKVDSINNMREFMNLSWTDFIDREKALNTKFNNDRYALVDLLYDYANFKERELRKKIKEKETELKAAAKSEKESKKSEKEIKVTRALNNPMIKGVLDDFGKTFHAQIKSDIMEVDRNNVEKWFDNGVFTKKDPYYYSPEFIGMNTYEKSHKRQFYQIYRNSVSHLLDKEEIIGSGYNKSEKIERLKLDWEKSSDFVADRKASTIVERWKYKMALKIGEIFDRKGGGEVKISGPIGNQFINFKFNDGSGFSMMTKRVFAISKLGNPFSRFPTTFHNVVFSNGERMNRPSVDRMQKEFGVTEKDMSGSITADDEV